MRVSQLAKSAGVSAETVRHYTELGMLSPSRDPHNGSQQFSKLDLQRLHFIARARRQGFSLKDCQRILASADQGQAPCADVRELMQGRLSELKAHIEECTRLAAVMETALDSWADKGECAPDGQAICRLIEDFEAEVERRPASPCPAH